MSTLQTYNLKHPDASGNQVTFTSGGLVGVGTAAPGTGTSSYYDDLVVKNDTAGTGAGITIQSNSTNGFSGLDLRTAGGTEIAKIAASAATSKLSIDAGGSTAITVDSSQRVGIGATSPASLLSVERGNVQNRGQWSDCAIALHNPTNTGSYSQIGFGYTPSQTYASAYLGFISTSQATSGKGDIVFGTRDVVTDTQPSEKLRLTSDGKLLVGTSSTTLPHQLFVAGSTRTNWFTCDTQNKAVPASDTAVLTINGSNPTFVKVYIKVNFGANGGLQAHFDYDILTCDSLAAGGGAAIRQSLNESGGSFQVSTSDFAVTRSSGDIIITYTNQAFGANDINFYVNGLFNSLSIA